MASRLTANATVLMVAAWFCGCWPSDLHRITVDAAADAAVPTALDAAGDLGFPFQGLAPCLFASDYDHSATTVAFGGQLGTRFSPKCLTVAAGTTVTFSGAFDTHPLIPSIRGTPSSPIVTTTTGSIQAFTFAHPGFFPYYCGRHGDSSGGGMSGVVEVTP